VSSPTVIILLGAPGAGKGTQAKRLSAARSLPHVSTGDLFRENIGKGTELGKQVKSYLDQGILVPDEVVLDMLFDRVSQPDCARGYVLDGFPRTGPQAEALAARLDEEPVVVNIAVADETIVGRAAGRLVCRKCGNVQHAEFAPPTVAGVCDECGGELYQREDDRPDVVRQRLDVYHAQTAPLIDFYERRGNLHTIDGEGSPPEVFSLLEGAVAAA